MSGKSGYTRDDLITFSPAHDSFVGIDSDGCVFDTMGVKQIKHFHPLIIRFWGLEKIERQLRAAAEFANLFSKWRGTNRFVALLKCFDLLHEWPEVRASRVTLPDTSALRRYVESGLPLSNPSLKTEVARTGDPELKRLLEWSLAVNEDIGKRMEAIPPFPGVEGGLKKIRQHSDIIVVSQTPEEALVREWSLHGLQHYVQLIAGQELGTKSDHLRLAAGGKYPPHRILMIGDAQGDRKAAQAVGARFYPIHPGREVESWRRFNQEAYDRFLAGSFTDEYQDQLVAEFEASLPEAPPWISSSA